MLDIAIGLVLIYLVLALLTTAVVEWWAQRRALRPRILRAAIARLFDEEPGADGRGSERTRALYAHPQIRVLGTAERDPSYIPTTSFTRAALDVLADAEASALKDGALLAALERSRQHGAEAGAAVALAALREYPNDRRALRRSLGHWFESAMQRLAGRYRRRLQPYLIGIAAIATIMLNADTLHIISVLQQDEALRQQLVDSASVVTASDSPTGVVSTARQALPAAHLLGWGAAVLPTSILGWLAKVIGLAITVAAASQGAPFWFDLLQKLVNLRASRQPELQDGDPDEAPLQKPRATGGHTATATTGTPALEIASLAAWRAFDPARINEHLPNLRWAVHLALLGYEDDAAERLRTYGLRADQVHDAGSDTEVLITSDAEVVLIAFRGTESEWEDISTDARFSLRSLDGVPGRVHDGFADALEAIWDVLLPMLQRHRDAGQVVWLVGHSLGGALATLAAARLAGMPQPPRIGGVVTIGQPRVGDLDFAHAYNDVLGLQDRHWRIVFHRDLVTRIPPRSFGYRHVGQVRYIDSTGAWHDDPGFWYRFIDGLPIDQEEALAVARDHLGDHAGLGYAAALDRLVAKMG